MKTITVFTPTYNRAYCLHKCYDSLVNQTNKDFLWLIIDDGSIDETKKLVQKWINENIISIKYHYKDNGGMHSGHNAAYSLIDTPLNVCIDSDDYMPENAIEKIIKIWNEIKGEHKFAGIIGLDATPEGEIIGDKIPVNIKETTLYDVNNTLKLKGDKKLVLRTDVVKKYPPYPIFEGERFVPLGYLYLLIDQDFVLYPTNEILCHVEYMADGSSLNIIKQYRRHPNGFAFSRKSRMQLSKSFRVKFRNAIHYVSCSIFLKNHRFISESPNKPLTLLAVPLGILLNLYIRYKTKQGY